MLPAWCWVALVFGLGAKALLAGTSGNPYLSIPDRNVFHLNRPKSQPTEPPPAPLVTVKVVGITTLLPEKLTLLKLNLPARPPEPAREVACILRAGEREGPIEVLEIDERAGRVKVNNAGTVTTLMLEKESPRPPNAPPLPNPPPLPIQVLSRR